jgi:hypothetical protein
MSHVTMVCMRLTYATSSAVVGHEWYTWSTRVEHLYLSKCISRMILGSQLPPKIVNFLFTVTSQKNEWTVLWGS